jgi:hypothetical protein
MVMYDLEIFQEEGLELRISGHAGTDHIVANSLGHILR